MQTPRIAELLEVVRQTKAAHLKDKVANRDYMPKGYNQLVPLDELMHKVGSYMAQYGNFEHRSSIKSLVYGVSESHLSDGRKSPRFEADQVQNG